MSDLISRLRTIAAAPNLIGPSAEWCGLAADRIEALERENAELREALKPFAESDMRFTYENGHCESLDSCVCGVCDFTVGNLVNAAAAFVSDAKERKG